MFNSGKIIKMTEYIRNTLVFLLLKEYPEEDSDHIYFRAKVTLHFLNTNNF